MLCFFLLLISILIESCFIAFPTYTKYYQGVTLPDSSIAYIETKPTLFGGADVSVVSIDGGGDFLVSGWDGTSKISILPGRHKIKIRYHHEIGNKVMLSDNDFSTLFIAEAGHIYKVDANVKNGLLVAVIMDLDSGQVVSYQDK